MTRQPLGYRLALILLKTLCNVWINSPLCVVGGTEGKRSDAKCRRLILESSFLSGEGMFLLLFLCGLFALVLAEFAFRSHIIKRRVSKLQRAACAVGGLEYICIRVDVPKASSSAQALSVPGSYSRQEQTQKKHCRHLRWHFLTFYLLLLAADTLLSDSESSLLNSPVSPQASSLTDESWSQRRAAARGSIHSGCNKAVPGAISSALNLQSRLQR